VGTPTCCNRDILITMPRHPIPHTRHLKPETENLNLDCAKCGACTAVCPIYQVSGQETAAARGKLHLLARLAPAAASPAYAEILSRCLLCGACRNSCPQQIDTPARIIAARRELNTRAGSGYWKKFLARQILARPSLLHKTLALATTGGGRLLRYLPEDSGLRLRLGFLSGRSATASNSRYVEMPERSTADVPAVTYFVGCLADHLEQSIARATAELTRRVTGAAPETPSGQSCCGQAAYSCGESDQARKLAKRNIIAFADNELPILTSCSSCYHHLLRYPELLYDEPAWRERAAAFAGRLLEFSSYFEGKNAATNTSGTIFYHDPCHLRYDLKITRAPRQLLRSAGLDLVESAGGPRCCGQGGLFHLAHPVLSGSIRDRLLAESKPDTDLMTTTCSGCLLQWRQGLALAESKTTCRHLAEVLAGPLP
jgi:glycolate oxidase iron-sulfur subunit